MDIYDNFKDCLKEDYKHKYEDKFAQFSQPSHCGNGSEFESWTVEQYADNSCLCELNKMLLDQDRSLAHFKLPEPDPEHEQAIQNFLLKQHVVEGNDELSIETAKEFFNKNFPLLNEGQRHVFDTMKKLIEEQNNVGVLVFFDAPGRMAKTFVLNILVSWIRMKDQQVASSETSGIASTLLFLGRTAHNRFKFPIPIFEDSICNVSKQSDLAKFLLSIALGITDEGPMLDRLCYEALDRTMKDLAEECDKRKKFGGKLIPVSGDFRQLMPVIPKANPENCQQHLEMLRQFVG
ncbi:hypothetical protein ACHAWF_014414 [Thalassiosira exigua]